MSATHSRASGGPLPLLCALGRHKTDLLVRWNDGYYFTRCRRCGLELVRTAFSGWTVPKGYRVVWQAEPPPPVEVVETEQRSAEPHAANAVAADTAPEETGAGEHNVGAVEFPIREAPEPPMSPAPRPTMTEEAFAARPADESLGTGRATHDRRPPLEGRKDRAGGLPIEDVLKSLRDEPEDETALQDEPRDDAQIAREDPVEERRKERGGEASPPPAQPARVRSPLIPDFMEEEFPGITWDPSTGRILTPTPGSEDEPRPEAKPGWREAVRDRAQAATASGLEMLRTRRPSEVMSAGPSDVSSVAAHSGPRRSLLERQGGVIAATIFGAFVLAAAVVDASADKSTRLAYRPELRAGSAETLARPATRTDARSASAARPAGNDQAFVTASLLNCRAVPTNDGETVRRLERGDAVKVLGADPGWVSILHQGRQCWASSEYISTVKPL